MNKALFNQYMVRSGYTQRSLARKMGMSKNTLNSKVNGRSQFNMDEAMLACELMNITDDVTKAGIFLRKSS